MMLSLLVAAINLDDVAQTLESMERQANGQCDAQHFVGMRPTQMLGQCHEIGTAEVQVFEDEQHQTGGYDADNETFPFEFGIISPLFDEDAGGVVNSDGDEKNEDVFGNEPHVKKAARTQQQYPSQIVRYQIEQDGYYREEN